MKSVDIKNSKTKRTNDESSFGQRERMVIRRQLVFTLEEKSGGLPYTATWISLDGRQCAKHFPTIDELYGFDKHLETLEREASLQLNIRECKVKLST